MAIVTVLLLALVIWFKLQPRLQKVCISRFSLTLKQSFQILGKLSGSFRIYPPDDVSCVGDDKRVRPRALHFYQRGTKVIVTYLNHGVVYVVKVQWPGHGK